MSDLNFLPLACVLVRVPAYLPASHAPFLTSCDDAWRSLQKSKDAQDAIQKLTDKFAKVIDEKVAAKEKDILKV